LNYFKKQGENYMAAPAAPAPPAAAPSGYYARPRARVLRGPSGANLNAFLDDHYHLDRDSLAGKNGGQTRGIFLARVKLAALEPSREESPVEGPTVERMHNAVLKIFQNKEFKTVADVLSGARSEAHGFKLTSDRVVKLNAVIGYDEVSSLIMRITDLANVINPDRTIIIGSETERGSDYDLFDVLSTGMGLPAEDFLPTGRLKFGRALDIFEQLLQALQETQEDGCCYRDAKPENIVFDEYGGLKLCDLGYVAPIKPPEGADEGIHREELLRQLGTLSHVAPEVLKRGSAWCEKSDGFSAAIVAYEMLFDRPLLSFTPLVKSDYLPLLRKEVSRNYDEQRAAPIEGRDLFGFAEVSRDSKRGDDLGGALIERLYTLEGQYKKGNPVEVVYALTRVRFEAFVEKVIRRGGTEEQARSLYAVLLGLLDHNSDTRMSLGGALGALSSSGRGSPKRLRRDSDTKGMCAPAAAKPAAAAADADDAAPAARLDEEVVVRDGATSKLGGIKRLIARLTARLTGKTS
jgi:serine/threonine protein kinase